MAILLLFLLIAPVLAQDFSENFDKMIVEINRTRYDKALTQLFPIQRAIYAKREGKGPTIDSAARLRMQELTTTTAVISTVALLRNRMEAQDYEAAQLQAMLAGYGLSRLWSDVPAHRRLAFAQEDYDAAPPDRREFPLRTLGFAAVEAKDWALTHKVALQLLNMGRDKATRTLDPGALEQIALTLRGLAELGTADKLAAEKTLVESMKVRGEMIIRDSGPNFMLASALLDQGSRAAVDQFLELVEASVWRQASRAADWRKQLAAGQKPDFRYIPAK